jgi:hypothetical protein
VSSSRSPAVHRPPSSQSRQFLEVFLLGHRSTEHTANLCRHLGHILQIKVLTVLRGAMVIQAITRPSNSNRPRRPRPRSTHLMERTGVMNGPTRPGAIREKTMRRTQVSAYRRPTRTTRPTNLRGDRQRPPMEHRPCTITSTAPEASRPTGRRHRAEAVEDIPLQIRMAVQLRQSTQIHPLHLLADRSRTTTLMAIEGFPTEVPIPRLWATVVLRVMPYRRPGSMDIHRPTQAPTRLLHTP